MWEIIGYSVLGILLILFLLLLVPVCVRCVFNGEMRLCVRVLGIPVFRYSSQDESEAPDVVEKPSRLRGVSDRLKQDGAGALLNYIKELVKLAAGTARRLIAAVTVDKLSLQLYITGSDAAQTAENTGKVCSFLYPTVTALQQTVLRIKKREITVTPDFLAEEGRVMADVAAHVIPLRIVMIAIWMAFRYRMITKPHKEVSHNGKQSAELDGSVH